MNFCYTIYFILIKLSVAILVKMLTPFSAEMEQRDSLDSKNQTENLEDLNLPKEILKKLKLIEKAFK